MTNRIVFPKLEFLKLAELPSLVGFCRGIDVIDFPQLKEVRLQDIPQPNLLFHNNSNLSSNSEQGFLSLFPHKVSLPNLEVIKLTKLENLERLEHGSLSVGSLSKLKEFSVSGCGKLLCVFASQLLPMLRDLETLTVDSCDLLEVVFEFEGVDSSEPNPKILSPLKSVVLWYLPKLNYISKRDSTGFKYIQTLNIFYCNSLRYVFAPTMTKSIPQLRNLRIGRCEMLSRIVAEENGLGESSVDEVEFPQLKSLALTGLPNLVSFFPNVNTTSAKSSDYYHNPVQPQPLFNEKVEIPCLEYLQLSGLENVRNVFNPSMAGGLVNLQNLSIDDCSTLEVVVGKEEEVGHGRKIDKTLFPQLIKLQLGSLPKLKRFCHFTQPLEIPLLRDMGIPDCPSMDAFSLGHVSVPNLSLPGISWNGDLNNAVKSLQKKSAIATEGAPRSHQQVPPTPFMSQMPFPGKQKIVIKVVAMETQKSRSKALKTVVGVSGVESAAVAWPDKDQVEVIGDGIDPMALIKQLRKNVGPCLLVSVGPVPMKKVHLPVGGVLPS